MNFSHKNFLNFTDSSLLCGKTDCSVISGASDLDLIFLPHKAVFIKEVEKTKCKEVGRNKEGAADQSIFGCQLNIFAFWVIHKPCGPIFGIFYPLLPLCGPFF